MKAPIAATTAQDFYNQGLRQVNYSTRASLRADTGDQQGSIADLTEAIRYQEIQPLAGWDYFNRGKLRFELKDYQGAIADYTVAIKSKPNFVQAYLERSKAHSAVGDQRGAIADQQKAASLPPPPQEEFFAYMSVPKRCPPMDK